MRRRAGKWTGLIVGGILVCTVLLIGGNAAGYLIVDAPRKSDVILVLAGETHYRPERARQLLAQGYARKIILDVPAEAKIYDFTQLQLAEKYIQGLPEAASMSVCPIYGLSTKDESKDVEKCLAAESSGSVLLVTSDFHTRRALGVFRREVPGHEYSIAASRDDTQFGTRWWTHRQWAKVCLDEWLRFLWWKAVDQWR